jgi:hypothetical protein
MKGDVKKYFGYYLMWTFLHLLFLVIGWNGDYHEYFWPFTGSEYSGSIKNAYDFSEFLVYALGPIVLIIGLSNIIWGGVEEKIDEEIRKRAKND